jgi:hypothetical protein
MMAVRVTAIAMVLARAKAAPAMVIAMGPETAAVMGTTTVTTEAMGEAMAEAMGEAMGEAMAEAMAEIS